MANTTWTGGGHDGKWTTGANWSNGVPGAGDDVFINPGSPNYPTISTPNVSIYKLTIVGGGSLNIAHGGALGVTNDFSNAGTLTLSGGTLSEANGVLNSGAISGNGEINAAIDNSGASATIEANGGTLKLDSVLSGAGNLVVDSSSTLDLAGGGSAASVAFSGSGGALSVGSQTLIVNSAITVAADNTITIGGGTLIAVNGVTDQGAISGFGTIEGELYSASGVVSASGNQLNVAGSLDGGLTLQIGAGAGISLATGGSASSVDFASASGGTLELAARQGLSLDNALDVGGNTIKLDGADTVIVVTGGVTIAGGRINDGTVVTDGAISGHGTISSALDTPEAITASGGQLNLTGAQTNNALHVASNGVLEIHDWSGSINSLTFDASGGAATIGSDITVFAGLTVGSGNALTVDGTLRDVLGISLAGGELGGAGALTEGTKVTGEGVIDLDINGNHTITASGGDLVINGHVDQNAGAATAFQINAGATLTINGAIGPGADPTVKFTGADGELTTAGAPSFGTINGFHVGDVIDLTSFSGGATISLSGPNQATVTSHNGHVHEVLTFTNSGNLSGLKVDSQGDVTICFMPGTMIRTPDGEVAVETLRPGDLVATHLGEAKPVNWVGRQTQSRRFSTPLRSWPVRVRAGALGSETPARDLLLSPDHALLIDGVLINAGALVNGTSITRETSVPDVWTYYHVELDDHSLILAEGAPAETFVDNVDRLNFDNWAEYEALYPEGKTVAEMPYPRAKSHRQVPVYIRIRQAERALAIGAEETAAAVA